MCLFAGVVSDRQFAQRVLALRNTTWTGPFHLKAGGMVGLMALPIFVDGPGFEGTQGPFNGPVGPTNCSACTYNAATNTRFWGERPGRQAGGTAE